jgi:hypothetical protein
MYVVSPKSFAPKSSVSHQFVMQRINFCGTFAAGEKGKSHRKVSILFFICTKKKLGLLSPPTLM